MKTLVQRGDIGGFLAELGVVGDISTCFGVECYSSKLQEDW
jgi:hypothetical protein